MARVGDMVLKVRSKNAGPFWLTIDIFCGTPDVYQQITAALSAERAAALFKTDPAHLKRFEIADLNVVKISLPRPQVQGTGADRDMHGASFANLVAEMEL